MICPKCGRNIEGNSCPYCDELEIYDRTQEYMERRARYVKELQEEESEKEVTGPFVRKKKKFRTGAFSFRRLIVPLAVAGGGIAAAGLIFANVDLTKRKTYSGSLYFTSQGQVLKIGKSSTSTAGKSDELAYSANRTAFFTVKIPEALARRKSVKLDSYMTDNKGSIFAGTGYDSAADVNKYVLYIWDNNGNYAKIAESQGLIGLKYISVRKEVLYTSTSVVNDQGGLGKAALNLYRLSGLSGTKADGKNSQLSDSISDVSVYESINKVIYLDTAGGLYWAGIESPETRVNIGGSVSRFETENPLSDNEFIKNENLINSNPDADSICYLDGRSWKLFDLNDFGRIDLGSGNDTSANFVYDKKNRYVYKISGGGLSIARDPSGNKDESVNYELLEKDLIQTSYIWFDDDSSLIYTDKNGAVKVNGKSGTKTISTGAEDGSLLRVQNSNGYIFKSAGALNYARNAKAKPYTIASDIGHITKAGFFDNNIYMLIGSELKSVSSKGGDIAVVGRCEEFWVGEN